MTGREDETARNTCDEQITGVGIELQVNNDNRFRKPGVM